MQTFGPKLHRLPIFMLSLATTVQLRLKKTPLPNSIVPPLTAAKWKRFAASILPIFISEPFLQTNSPEKVHLFFKGLHVVLIFPQQKILLKNSFIWNLIILFILEFFKRLHLKEAMNQKEHSFIPFFSEKFKNRSCAFAKFWFAIIIQNTVLIKTV